MAKRRYQKQWLVPSDTDSEKTYKVSLTLEGEYQCSCPRWIFSKPRKDCKHIGDVKNGCYDQNSIAEYTLLFAMVKEVTMLDDRQTIHVPLMPVGDTDFCATILYDLVQIGVPWQVAAELEHVPRSWNPKAVEQHIKAHGRKIYGQWVEHHGFQGFERVWV